MHCSMVRRLSWLAVAVSITPLKMGAGRLPSWGVWYVLMPRFSPTTGARRGPDPVPPILLPIRASLRARDCSRRRRRRLLRLKCCDVLRSTFGNFIDHVPWFNYMVRVLTQGFIWKKSNLARDDVSGRCEIECFQILVSLLVSSLRRP